jgi:uncharacterized membrane protein YeaQ/YmgE (transglycosylase-associated protein family)
MLTFNGNDVSLTQLIVWLLVALISGMAAEVLIGYSHVGMISATVIGMFGALFGTWLADRLHLPSLLTLRLFDVQIELIWSIVGSVLLVILLQTFRIRRGGGGYGRRSSYRREY